MVMAVGNVETVSAVAARDCIVPYAAAGEQRAVDCYIYSEAHYNEIAVVVAAEMDSYNTFL